MDALWSASTTMRNPERTLDFLKTTQEIEGEVWNDETQCKYQILLIKNRFYTPTAQNLTERNYAIVSDFTKEMTYEEAEQIFFQKKYVDAPMRGRTSFDPLEKMGLVRLDSNNQGLSTVQITNFGRLFLSGNINLDEVVFTSLLKTQFPNPLERAHSGYNIKPFICTLRLIKQVNKLCLVHGLNAVGISREEFGIFVLSLKTYLDIDDVAERIINFREYKRNLTSVEERQEFVYNYISQYLKNFINPHKNIKEYTDNIIRYLRLTKYIYIRGGGYYIDLEPRRMIEIEAILDQDNGQALTFTESEYKEYISDYYAYTLPFETITTLTEIAQKIINEIQALSTSLGVSTHFKEIPTKTEEIKQAITVFRRQRTELQNLKMRQEYQDMQRIKDTISALLNTLSRRQLGANRPSVELEKWVNIALIILNDALLIKPNAPLGDDNEPTFTAPANVPDIECYYRDFKAICEVTMLTSREQWYYEGQPVMRHLRAFEQAHSNSDNYCLFIAPRLHVDTINTFWTAVKYEYEGRQQKIIPITITSLVEILKAVLAIKEVAGELRAEDIRHLYDKCLNIADVSDSTRWVDHIKRVISAWVADIVARSSINN